MPQNRYPEDFYIRTLLERIKIKDIMTVPVVTIYEDEELSDAEERFINRRVSYLPVISRDNRVVGLLSQKYLYKTLSPRKILNKDLDYQEDMLIDGDTFYSKEMLNSYMLRHVMFKDPFTLPPEASVGSAVLNMSSRRIGCIPIVNQDKSICGIFTNQDIVDFSARILSE